MRSIMKTVKYLEDSSLLIKDAGEPTENEVEIFGKKKKILKENTEETDTKICLKKINKN